MECIDLKKETEDAMKELYEYMEKNGFEDHGFDKFKDDMGKTWCCLEIVGETYLSTIKQAATTTIKEYLQKQGVNKMTKTTKGATMKHAVIINDNAILFETEEEARTYLESDLEVGCIGYLATNILKLEAIKKFKTTNMVKKPKKKVAVKKAINKAVKKTVKKTTKK